MKIVFKKANRRPKLPLKKLKIKTKIKKKRKKKTKNRNKLIFLTDYFFHNGSKLP